MEFPAVKDKVAIAISCFRSNDSELLDFDHLDLPERPVSHRLGYYMQSLFNSYDVDCEYNKHLLEKKLEGIPDIIVHKRKTDDCNLLAIEVKTRRNRSEIQRAKDRGEILEDYEKLRQYTSLERLRYRWGLFILLFLDETITEWFESGREMQKLTVT